MDTLKTPEIEPRFHAPKNWEFGGIERTDRNIRFGFVAPKTPKALIIAFPGLSEFCEKYFEMANECLDKNYAFLCLDWAGQGLSSRFLENPLKRHSEGFDEDLLDVLAILEHIPKELQSLPKALIAHSMGAHIGMRFMLEYPSVFSCAALSAPLLELHAFRNWATPLIPLATGAFNLIMGQSHIIGLKDWREDQTLTPQNNPFSSDPARAEIHPQWCEENPALSSGLPTHGWLHEVVKSNQTLWGKLKTKTIETPCIMGVAGKDTFVDNAKIYRAVKDMPNTQILDYPNAAHEILMEVDAIRTPFIESFFDLIEKTAS